MINKDQIPPLSCFYPYFGLDPYLWLQSTQNINSILQVKKEDIAQQNPNNHLSVKVEENQDFETQKAENHSS
jgi:hypothetical protein